MKTYLVTGASGYIGSVLCKKLKEHGYRVLSVDTKDTRPLYSDKHWYRTDFSIPGFVRNSVFNENVDGIFHLAAESLLGPSAYDPLKYFIGNTSKTTNLIDLLIRENWNGKFVFASTAAVYGNHPNLITESDTKNPINNYGISKLQVEQVLKSVYDAHGFSSVMFRFFNVTGGDFDVGQNKNEPHILTKMCKAAAENSTFQLYGYDYNTKDHTCIRDYVHVCDIAQSHILALDYLDKNPGCHDFNLGTGSGTSNLELVNTFRECTGVDLKMEFTAKRIGDPDYLVASSAKFMSATGYTFPYSNLTNIITTHWDYYNEQ